MHSYSKSGSISYGKKVYPLLLVNGFYLHPAIKPVLFL